MPLRLALTLVVVISACKPRSDSELQSATPPDQGATAADSLERLNAYYNEEFRSRGLANFEIRLIDERYNYPGQDTNFIDGWFASSDVNNSYEFETLVKFAQNLVPEFKRYPRCFVNVQKQFGIFLAAARWNQMADTVIQDSPRGQLTEEKIESKRKLYPEELRHFAEKYLFIINVTWTPGRGYQVEDKWWHTNIADLRKQLNRYAHYVGCK